MSARSRPDPVDAYSPSSSRDGIYYSRTVDHESLDLPGAVERFVVERTELGGVSAALLYGSYARGTQHEKSDVDIIFVVDEGFRSELVVHEGLDFEVLEATKSSMFDHWRMNWDEDRHWYLWKDAVVIYDRDDDGAEIVEYARSRVGERLPWSPEQIENRRQVMLAKFERIKYLSRTDPGTSAILLVELVGDVAQSWFKINGRFVPSPKEFLATFAEDCPRLEDLFRDFHLNSSELEARFGQAENMLKVVYC